MSLGYGLLSGVLSLLSLNCPFACRNACATYSTGFTKCEEDEYEVFVHGFC